MRLIDAEALINEIKEEASANYAAELYGVSNGLRIAETFVNDAPTITLDQIITEHNKSVLERMKEQRYYE